MTTKGQPATTVVAIDPSTTITVTPSGTTTTADTVVDATVSGGKVQVADSAGDASAATTATQTTTAASDLNTLIGAAAAPGAAVAIVTNNSLPAAGAYESAPTTSNSTGIAVPTGTVAKPTRGATLTFIYTQGASGGQMAAKVYAYDGTSWGQMPSPVDQSYSGVPLGSGTGRYELAVELKYGISRVFVACAEVGATGTPGSYSCEAVFG